MTVKIFLNIRLAQLVQATGRKINGSIPGKSERFFSKISSLTLWPNPLPVQWALGVLSQGVKRREREAEFPCAYSAEVKFELSYNFYSPCMPS